MITAFRISVVRSVLGRYQQGNRVAGQDGGQVHGARAEGGTCQFVRHVHGQFDGGVLPAAMLLQSAGQPGSEGDGPRARITAPVEADQVPGGCPADWSNRAAGGTPPSNSPWK